jgi:ABC-2 type transport system ATP-binding protein
MSIIIQTAGLGRRYGRDWALRDCSLTVPEGHLVALVGPNGAGKTTLLNIVVGLTAPTQGTISVLDGVPAGSIAALDGIAFVAQDMPLYRNLSVADMLHLTRNLNHDFDVVYARRRLDELGIAQRRTTGKLSGGQRAQLALTLALARHPRLLVLDEPTAPLDPVARHEFMATVVTAMTDDAVSVILSSHALAELERVADYLVLLTRGAVRINGAVDDLLEHHLSVTGPADAVLDPRWDVLESRVAGAHQSLLVRVDEPGAPPPDRWEVRSVGVEELAMAYLRESPDPTRRVAVQALR